MSGRRAQRAAVFSVLILALMLVPMLVDGPGPVWALQASVRLQDPTNGQEVGLQGNATLTHLVFFATWCPQCLEELDELAEIEARWRGRGYRQVWVAVPTRHTPERLKRFIQDRQPPGRVLFDATGEVTQQLRARQLPTHVLLDARQQELARGGSLDAVRQQVETHMLARRK